MTEVDNRDLAAFTKYQQDRIEALTRALRETLEALKNLVSINETWNAAVQEVIGRPVAWNDSYLDEARKAIAKAEGRS